MGKPRIYHKSNDQNTLISIIKKREHQKLSRITSSLFESTEGNEIDEYSDLKKEEENPNNYGPSGFMKVKLGETIEGYTIIRKTGFGTFSTVWLAYDLQTHKFAALKIAKARKDEGKIEQRLLNYIRNQSTRHPGYDRVVHVLDQFLIYREGYTFPFPCTVLEPLGSSLLSKLFKSENGIELPAIQKIARQMLQGLQYLEEECALIHTDIKPENVLVTIPTKRMYEITQQIMDEKFECPGIGYNAPKKQRISSHRIKKLTKIYNEICSHAAELNPSESAQTGEVFQGMLERADEVEDWELEDCGIDDKPDSILCGESQQLPSVTKPSSGYVFPTNIPGTEFKRFQYNRKRLKVFKEIMDPAVNIKIIDVGCATHIDRAVQCAISTLGYRAPEVISEVLFTPAADIWSTACVLFELTTGECLIDLDPDTDESEEGKEMYRKMSECLGPIPGQFYAGGKKYHEYFDADGIYLNEIKPGPSVLTRLVEYGYSETEVQEFSDFLNDMLDYNYKRRSTASECLQHPFLKRYLS